VIPVIETAFLARLVPRIGRSARLQDARHPAGRTIAMPSVARPAKMEQLPTTSTPNLSQHDRRRHPPDLERKV
jgi:hypothetical protein